MELYSTPGDFPPAPTDTKFHSFLDEWQRRSNSAQVDWSLGLPANTVAEKEARETHNLRRSSEELRTRDVFLGNVLISNLASERLIADVQPHPALLFGLASSQEQVDSFVEKDGRLWMGDAGHISHLHFDAHDGFLCTIVGLKRVWLYEPISHIDVIPMKPNTNAALLNPLHYANDTLAQQKFPKFAASKPHIIDVHPGDILFIPTSASLSRLSPFVLLTQKISFEQVLVAFCIQRISNCAYPRNHAFDEPF